MNSVEALRNAAREAEQSGNWQHAADLYEQLLRLGALDSWDRIWRARALLFAGHTADAATLIESLPATGDERATVIGLQADLRERLEQYEEARKLWVQAREAGFSAYWCLFGEARACFFGQARTSARRQLDEAQELMAQALAHPDLSQDRDRHGIRFATTLEKAKTKVESEQLIRFEATVVAGTDRITGRETRTLVGANFTGEITDWPAMQIAWWLESFYGNHWQVQALLTLSLADLPEAIRRHDCHLLMLHVPRDILGGTTPHLLSLDGIIRMPTLELTTRVASVDDLLRHSKNLRKEVRKLASRGYGYSIGGKQDWPGFVAMYQAFVRARHGRIGLDEFQDPDSDMMRYFDDGNILEREFRLLKVEKDGDWVAAVLLNIDDVPGRYVPTCSGISRRIPPGVAFLAVNHADRLARAGVLWFSLDYLLKSGSHEVYLSDAAPWTSSGLLIFKSKYHPEVVASPFDLCLGFRTKEVRHQLREWLINNPVFTRNNSARLVINLHPQAPEALAKSCGDVCAHMANRPEILTRDLLRHYDLGAKASDAI